MAPHNPFIVRPTAGIQPEAGQQRSPENNIVVADRSASRAPTGIYFDADTANRPQKRLEALGYQVTLEKRVVAMAV